MLKGQTREQTLNQLLNILRKKPIPASIGLTKAIQMCLDCNPLTAESYSRHIREKGLTRTDEYGRIYIR